MLGYRIVREADFTALVDELREVRAARIQLLQQLNDAAAEARSKATMADLLITRCNVLEKQNAIYLSRITALPHDAAAIAKGSPVSSAALGAGADLFEDVGDEAAARLKDRGLLHDAEEVLPFPAARDIAPDPSLVPQE
jgi:hypothetical protein